jgi:peptidyl-prolyl cis-trans isomerase A (cyclophilin A)
MRHRQTLRALGSLLASALLGIGLASAQETQVPVPASSEPQSTSANPAPATAHVLLKTSLGDIVLALEIERAPITAANFLHYVDQKRLDGTTFYRALVLGDDGKYGLIQGGLRGNPKRVFKPIAHEPTTVTGLSHTDGALSMARGDVDTATSDFFIIVGGLSSLDAQPNGGDPGYAVFGHVVDGMDVVHAILGQPTSPTEGEGAMKGQMLLMPIKILSARRAD